MRINGYLTLLIASAALIAPSGAAAQGGGRGTAYFHVGGAEILNVEPMENVPSIANAPFTADATTEFTQMLSDGNRIERRFTTSLARDGRGRTRSEQDVAMLGPLVVLQKGMNWTHGSAAAAAHGEPPRFIVITDPIERRHLYARRTTQGSTPQLVQDGIQQGDLGDGGGQEAGDEARVRASAVELR